MTRLCTLARPCAALLLLALPSVASCQAAGGAPASDRTASPRVIRVVSRNYSFAAPAQAEGGRVTVRLVNEGTEPHYLRLMRLAPGKTLADFVAWRGSGTPAPEWMSGAGGPAPVMPGDSTEQTTVLQAGTYVILCSYPTEQGVPHVQMGMFGSMQVTASGEADAALPAADGRLTLADYAYGLEDGLRAGTRTIEVENRGREPHQVLLIRLPPGVAPEAEVAWFRGGSRGPRPGHPHGGILEVLPGETTRFTTTLEPGEYMLLCGIRAPDGRRHFEHGMVKTLTVRG
ncbi:MAG TPA: cupredoxin domain-containing protein [Longimicrobium sp.]|nr:cupredoxin domain-containing protein [Longimicrobium sp.]